jgi:hypothetical protein
MFGLGPLEVAIMLIVAGVYCSVVGVVVAAAIVILRRPKPPQDPS